MLKLVVGVVLGNLVVAAIAVAALTGTVRVDQTETSLVLVDAQHTSAVEALRAAEARAATR